MISFIKNNILFLLGFVVLFFVYRFDVILWLRPQSIHQWRQADCLQITHNFLTESWNFFSPSIHNFFSDNETSGKTIGEFPLLYYVVAILWKVFGEHEFIYRMVNISIFFFGLLALYDLLKRLLDNNFWSLAITFFLFTSPLLIFYSNNFLTNVPAFSMVLMGWNFFYRYYVSSKNKYLFIAIGLFTLGGLLKMTAYISFIVIGAFYLIELFKKVAFKKDTKIFSNVKVVAIPLLISLALVTLWYQYASYFTEIHGGKYTFNTLWPIWEMKADQLAGIKKFATEIIIHQPFSIYSLAVLFVLLVALLIDGKKLNKFILVTTMMLVLGSFAFVLLWFQALEAHDYYVINLIILPLFILIGFAWHAKDNYPRFFNAKATKVLFSLFLLYNIVYAANNIRMRYWKVFGAHQRIAILLVERPEMEFWWWVGSFNSLEELNDIEPYNRSIGIKENDLVVYMPDQGFSTSLYLMNQKGWTSSFGVEPDSQMNTAQKLKDKIDNKNLKYLFIGDPELLEDDQLKPFLKHPVGNHKGVVIFSLKE